MNIILIYKSFHRMNTERIAKAMADIMDAKIAKVEEISPNDLEEYDLLGFGSGIYGGNYHKELMNFIDNMPPMNKDTFIFSTSGEFSDKYHNLIKLKLTGKGLRIVGEFACLGETSPLKFNLNLKGPLGWIGGKNKGHPDEKDLEKAREFAQDLMKK
jgi:flavodoxin